jgi:hypothetical protein
VTGLPPNAWDDMRLEEAFAARAARTPDTPSELGQILDARLRADRRMLPWKWLVLGAAVISVVLVAGGTQLLRTPQPNQTSPRAVATGAASSGSPSQPVDTVVATAIGDPITVSDALAIRDGSTDTDREILVSGFLSPVPVIYCALEYGPRNPTRPRCPEDHRWLMEQDEARTLKPPSGPALHPSFALVPTPEVPWPQNAPATPVPVVLLGHFHDRRAALCPETQRDECGQVFLVDRVVSIDRAEEPIETHRGTDSLPMELTADVDALVAGAAPGSILASRQLLPLATVFDVEPGLRSDPMLSNFSPTSQTTWLVTVIDLRAGVPVARTFMLLDGSSWFAEITSGGAQLRERTVQPPAPSRWPAMPSGEPSAFSSAPTSVLGIPVRSIGAMQADRQAAIDTRARDEMAVRAWYVGPAPTASCEANPVRIPPPLPPCDAARHWLLDDPQQFGLYPGQLRADPSIDRFAPVLNPIVPIDVPFEPGGVWRDDRPVPVPVVVLGHFSDNRVRTYAGSEYFVIDALAWTQAGPVASLDSEVRLSANAAEDASGVLARIAAVSPNVAVATWATVMEATDFPTFDVNFAQSGEFGTGTPVWIVRRLVSDETDGRGRFAIEWAWTHDGGTRIWLTPTPDSSPDLGTTLDLHDLDANTAVVRVFDYDEAITSVAPATGLTSLHWQQPLGNATDNMDVARGRTSHDLVLRWSGRACATSWRVQVRIANDGHVFLSPSTHDADCEGPTVVRRILISFVHSIDIDKVEGPSCCG